MKGVLLFHMIEDLLTNEDLIDLLLEVLGPDIVLSVLEKKPKELFAEFYEKQNEVPMNEIEKMILKQVLDEMEETTGDTN